MGEQLQKLMVMIGNLKIKIEYFGYVIDKTQNAQISMWQEKNKDKAQVWCELFIETDLDMSETRYSNLYILVPPCEA